MGEDRTMSSEKKNEVTTSYPCRHRHSSVISSCSEDAESESTSAGYPPTPDEERDEEFEYGPGIVNKLRTRFLSITLKQNRGTNMRRSCSMENLLDQDRPGRPLSYPSVEKATSAKPLLGNLKRAKSMDTLLMEMHPEEAKVVKSGLMPTICDEELPKPDTVKTYKRMFEPAESRRGYHGRRPPVLRASARSNSGSKVNGVSSPNQSSAKVNGTSVTRSKYSAKQLTPVKAQSPDISAPVNCNGKKSPESPRPLFNGCHVVKATPVKINNIRNGKEVENFNSINRFLNKKEIQFAPKTDNIICNRNVNHHDILEIKLNKDVVKQFTKNNMTNGNVKPKVPPNRPTLRSPRPLTKINEQPCNDLLSPTKAKPFLSNGLKKICENNNKSDSPQSPEPKSTDISKIPHQFPLKRHIKSPPPVNKPKEDFVWPPELKSKDTTKNKSINENAGIKNPEEKNMMSETVPMPEKKIKDIIQTLSESSVVKNETQLPEKPLISKLPERTAMVSPDLTSNKLLKTPTVPPPKVPLKQPTITANEPVKKPSNVLVDPPKKPVNGTMDTPKQPSNGFVDPSKKPVNGIMDTPKQLSNGFGDPSKKSSDESALDTPPNRSPSPCQPETKPNINGFVDPSKKPFNGSVLDTSLNRTPSPSQLEKKPNGITNPTKSPPLNGLPTTPVLKKSPANGHAGKASKQPTLDTTDNKRAIKKSPPQNTSMVFDFRGKDVVSHVAVLPTPFGCKSIHPKKRSETPEEDDDTDEDYVDYSVPPPSGVVFEGENIKIGKGSILAIRNKDLKITFDDDVDGNTFVYPSENSLLEDPEKSSTNEMIPNGQHPPNSKLKTNTSIGSSSSGGGLSSYTPSVLRTMDNFEPGMSVRPSPPPDKEVQPEKSGKEENDEVQEESEDLKPADPDLISSWSISAGTSDLLF
ncbi:hypothetical protein JTE90_020958 [Oedothorax gibbosus]|uniref:Uncharacterized protein n=1 Tax=Oedothorax gibbosus TaxID=931172 RepID=A0AAV6U843_9ARAC|nr:hypothetical protein JTE90_020958 [Oedothorax gibbosus]